MKILIFLLFFLCTLCGQNISLEELLDRGQSAFDRQDYQAAEKFYSRAVANYPNSLRARSGLAFTWLSAEGLGLISVLKTINEIQAEKEKNPEKDSTMLLVQKFSNLSDEDVIQHRQTVETNLSLSLREFYEFTPRLKISQKVWNLLFPVLGKPAEEFCRPAGRKLRFNCLAQLPHVSDESDAQVRMAMGSNLFTILIPSLYAIRLDPDFDGRLNAVEGANESIDLIQELESAQPSSPMQAILFVRTLKDSFAKLRENLKILVSPLHSSFSPLVYLVSEMFPEGALPHNFKKSLDNLVQSLERTERLLKEFATDEVENELSESDNVGTADKANSVADSEKVSQTLDTYKETACGENTDSPSCQEFWQEQEEFCKEYSAYIGELSTENEMPAQCAL
jgi:hypothetical protein